MKYRKQSQAVWNVETVATEKTEKVKMSVKKLSNRKTNAQYACSGISNVCSALVIQGVLFPVGIFEKGLRARIEFLKILDLEHVEKLIWKFDI